MALGLGGFGSALAVAADTLGLTSFTDGPRAPGTSMEIQVEGGDHIELRDRAMPFEEAAFPVEQRTKKTLYPGNPIASLQILGADNLPSELEGEWNHRFLPGSVVVNSDPTTIESPAQLCFLFDQIVRAGRTLKVQWLHYVRVGVLKKFEPIWLRSADCKWRMSFEWVAADDAVPVAKELGGGGFGISDLMSILNTAEDLMTLGPMIARSLAATLVSGIKSIREKVSKLIQVLGAVEALVNLPAALWGAIKSAVKSICDECREMMRRLSGPRLSSRGTSGNPEIVGAASSAIVQDPVSVSGIAQSGASQAVAFDAWARTMARVLSDVRHQAILIGLALEVRVRPEAAKTLTVREGETAWSVAAREYGSAEYANYLIEINHLQGARLVPGTTLRIPVRPFGAAADVEPTDTDVIDLQNPVPCQV
jgi:hypothetical protein